VIGHDAAGNENNILIVKEEGSSNYVPDRSGDNPPEPSERVGGLVAPQSKIPSVFVDSFNGMVVHGGNLR
jgi:hypothetical protein